ncbi:AraC family transcriptional regulator [Piscinibacter sp. XHJ-5]|uniref:AraC family transcriptional regulator n=1 Tax=Piscinibacter sp. XHJ-5 TaxID=3037797 RepID=UPI0024528D83|nr:AraC family transcriptional regulator [Piscinibacter sp. XHJ-5]
MPAHPSTVSRINRVIDYIDAHLTEPLDLQTLAAVAHFSPWHFHRVFHETTGETLAQCVRRRRLEVSAGRLVAAPEMAASRIALEVGFGSAEVFTRAFSAHFGVTPTAWRRGASRDWAESRWRQLSKIHQADRNTHQEVALAFKHDPELWPTGSVEPAQGDPMEVQIRTLPEVRVAYMRCVGPYGNSGIPKTWLRFAAWCEQQGLMQPRRTMYGVAHDNPMVTSPQQCRYDACVEVGPGFLPHGEIGVQALPGGRYACTRFSGATDEVDGAWGRFMIEGLPATGYRPDDGPRIEIYGADFAFDEKTGVFSCELCAPVVPV